MIDGNVVETILRWRKDPCSFVFENFGVVPDHWQKLALEAFVSGDQAMSRIALRACAGPGKTAVLAWCGWIFLSCYGEVGEHPKGACVSITESNLKDNLWPELSKWQSRSDYLSACFVWTKTKIYAKDHPETWFLSARTFSKSSSDEDQGKTLSGIHSEYVLFLIDESGEIPVTVLKAAEQAMSASKFAKIVQAGNPTSKVGMLYAAATTLAEQWYCIRINADPDDPNRTSRVSADWAREQIKTYGRKDPWVMAYILGEFPETAINTLLTLEEVEEAMGRHLDESVFSFSQKRLGVDVARFGLDSTVIFPRQGLAAFAYVTMSKADSMEVAARVMMAKDKWQGDLEFIDGTGGFGSGVVDSLRQAGLTPYEINFSSSAIDKKYYNKRSEMWFNMAEWVKRGGALPRCERLKKELCAPTYTFHNGSFRLEEKEQIKKRLKFSPDIADALCLTFALPDMPKETIFKGNKVGKAITRKGN